MKTCSHCGHEQNVTEFNPCKRTLDGKVPWCLTCLEKYRFAKPKRQAKLRAQYRRDYVREYRKAYREKTRAVMRPCYAIELAHNLSPLLCFITFVRRTKSIQFEGPSACREVGLSILSKEFSCDPTAITVSGRGGGSGSRWQPWVRLEAGDLVEAQFKAGMVRLEERHGGRYDIERIWDPRERLPGERKKAQRAIG